MAIQFEHCLAHKDVPKEKVRHEKEWYPMISLHMQDCNNIRALLGRFPSRYCCVLFSCCYSVSFLCLKLWCNSGVAQTNPVMLVTSLPACYWGDSRFLTSALPLRWDFMSTCSVILWVSLWISDFTCGIIHTLAPSLFCKCCFLTAPQRQGKISASARLQLGGVEHQSSCSSSASNPFKF